MGYCCKCSGTSHRIITAGPSPTVCAVAHGSQARHPSLRVQRLWSQSPLRKRMVDCPGANHRKRSLARVCRDLRAFERGARCDIGSGISGIVPGAREAIAQHRGPRARPENRSNASENRRPVRQYGRLSGRNGRCEACYPNFKLSNPAFQSSPRPHLFPGPARQRRQPSPLPSWRRSLQWLLC